MGINNQINIGSTPLSVSQGGSGCSSMSAVFAPICGGSSTTAQLQSSSVGMSNSGWVFTSNGSAAIPTFQQAPGINGAAKFWIKASGNGTSVIASFNVTSVTDNGIGDLTVTIGTDFSSSNWGSYVSIQQASLTATAVFSSQTAGSCRVLCATLLALLSTDPANYFISGFGDQ